MLVHNIYKNVYISFNGNNFDIPYLNARFYENQLFYSIKKYKSFDLYLYFKQKSQLISESSWDLLGSKKLFLQLKCFFRIVVA